MIPGRRYGLSDLPSILARRGPVALVIFFVTAAVISGIAVAAAVVQTRAENARREETPINAAPPSPSATTLNLRTKVRTLETNLADAERELAIRQARLETLRQMAIESSRAVIAPPGLRAAQSRLTSLASSIGADRAMLDDLQRASTVQPAPPPPSPELKHAESELAKAKAGLAELQERLTPQHPDVLSQQATVAEWQADVSRLANAVPVISPQTPSPEQIAVVEARIAAGENERRELLARIASLQRLPAAPPPEELELAGATREYEALQASRAALEGNLAAVRQDLGDALAQDKAVAAAITSAQAAALAPQSTDIVSAVRGAAPWAATSGLLAALIVGFLAEIRDGRIRDAADLQATTDLPHLGMISEIVPLSAAPPPAERELSTLAEPSSTTLIWHPRCPAKTIEQYRHVAHAVRRFRAERQARVIGVTSALPGEGKTLSSVNLAVSLAESYRQRVILIDADLRRPSVHMRFDLPATGGLTEWLTTDAPPEQVMVRLSSRLSIVPAGHPELNPVPLLTSLRMAMLIAAARADFDWVIVDTPPAGLITDAGVLEGSLDGFVMIVAAGRTPYGLLRQAIGTLGAERILGVMLNRTRRARGVENDTYAPYHLGGRRSA